MLILTHVTGDGSMATVFDSDDGKSEQVDLVVLAKRINQGLIKVYGLRPYKSSEVYPPDRRVVESLNIVIIASEASTALRRFLSVDEEE